MARAVLACVALAQTAVFAARPNFVFLFLDDMRLDDMVALPKVREHITEKGTNVTNFFVNTPVCCPSRATLLSGRYAHNNRVSSPQPECCMHMDILFGNVTSPTDAPNGNCSNPGWWQRSLPVHMDRAGYNNGLFGKLYHMGDDAPCGFVGDDYGPSQPLVETNSSVPFMLPGWHRQFVYCFPLDQYFWNRYLDQTTLVGTQDRPEEYATSLIGNKTVAWLRDDAIPAAKSPGGKPFFAYVALHPPHAITQPAPWYNESWPAEWGISQTNPLAKAKANYGYHGRDHHWLIANEPPISPSAAAATSKTFVQRLQMLLSADDVLDGVHETLQAGGVVKNTFLMVSSDHGWNLGEFRVMQGKHQMYEHTIRVPFAISGPGIPAGASVPQVMAMVDVMPTILELAGAVLPTGSEALDGKSFAPVLQATEKSGVVDRSTMLVEYFSLEENAPDEPACTGKCIDNPWSPGCLDQCFDLAISQSDVANNTFIGLRIINETHDLSYAEYTDVRDWHFENIYFKELFDLKADPFQLTNLISATALGVQEQLHQALRREFTCKGGGCQW